MKKSLNSLQKLNNALGDVKCHCGTDILKSYGDRYKIRSMLLVVDQDRVMAKCRVCKSEHELPVSIQLKKNISHNLHFVLDSGTKS